MYLADRVRNASTVWLGATVGCAECHDHKFDPYLAKDFYSFAAFFADVKEKPVGRREPDYLPDDEPAAALEALRGRDRAPPQASWRRRRRSSTAAQARWEKTLAGARAYAGRPSSPSRRPPRTARAC